MNKKRVLDLSQELPSFDVIVEEGRSIEMTVRDIYELAMEGAGNGVPLRDRIDKIAAKFNAKFNCSLDEDKMFVLMMHGLEAVEAFVGNTGGSSI